VTEEEARRAARYYNPNLPPEVVAVELPAELEAAVYAVAELIHDTWARERKNGGWRWGPVRNDAEREHPCLVPFRFLSLDEQKYDLATARTMVRFLIARGFRILPPPAKFLDVSA
jgi:ryanodine receptor 2